MTILLMNKIKIKFVDFWNGFIEEKNFFVDLLRESYTVEISDFPDFVFYSVFGTKHLNYSCTKIFFTGENVAPDFTVCDYAFSFDYLDNPNNYRLPLYNLSTYSYDKILFPKIIDDRLINRKFCNYVISNGYPGYRNTFIQKLEKYKHIDSGGRYRNNIGGRVNDKISFHNQYKFSITFENSARRGEHDGYTTEKIVEAMIAQSMPIYWGNPVVYKDFNVASFVNFYDFRSEKEMIDYIIYLDNNDDAYREKFAQPWHLGNVLPENNKRENIKAFLHKIFNE